MSTTTPPRHAARPADPLPALDPHLDAPELTEVIRRTRPRTNEDDLTLVGAVAASLATVWVLYEQVLPFSGALGFAVCWFFGFVAFYAALTAIHRPMAVVVDRVVTTFVIAAPSLVALALASTVISTVVRGFPALRHWNFFTDDMAGVRPGAEFTAGGAAHAMVGTLIEVGIAVGIAMPLGVITAIYMSEIGGKGARLVRTIVEAMTALPSIVAGLFIYTVLIVHFHFPTSGFAAALALAVMGLPIMARASDVVLRVVPGGLREASYALGAGKLQTVWRVVLPTARPGLATALILGIARMVGETSPLILTSGASTFMNTNPVKDPMNSLPLYIFSAVSSGDPRAETRGFAGATVLLLIVLALFLLARFVARGKKQG